MLSLERFQIETPCILVDHDRLLANIRQMQSKANAHGIRLRPHIKTHKSIAIAKLQIEHGAIGITASKADEALIFISAGIASATIAYPLIEARKIDRLLSAANARGTDVRFIVDSPTGIEAIAAAAIRHNRINDVFLKIDVGLHRCGLQEDNPELLTLAQKLNSNPGLRFLGLLSHAGHAYAAGSVAEVRAIAEEELAILMRVRSRIEDAGIEMREVSIGATPTVLASDNFTGVTEIRPGNYVFLDRTQLRLGVANSSQVALSILATVVSRNSDYFIVDAGSKVLSTDLGPHGTANVTSYGVACALEDYDAQINPMPVVKLSEEHGFVQREGRDIAVGTQLRIIPNHACPVVNLANELIVLENNQFTQLWKVDARGHVR
jgi:D-serine deaminase-like pyridoxal phosphate-dependent protein